MNTTSINIKEKQIKSSDLHKSIRLEEKLPNFAKTTHNELVNHRNQQSLMRKNQESIIENRAFTTAATIIG